MINFWKRSAAPPVGPEVSGMLRLTKSDNGNPNINDLWRVTKDLDAMKLTVKFFGYELAKALLGALPPLPAGGPFQTALTCRPSLQADLEANWTRYWSAQLNEKHAIHRRVWEYAFVLQALAQFGKLREGMTGLGFGCTDPLASYLAAKGCKITAVDSEEPSADQIFRSNLLDRAAFDRNVRLRTVDLNALPSDLQGFDFAWSVARLQHLGSIARGVAFMEAMVDTLKPGGVAVHTTEFSFAVDDQTIDNWGTVLFQRRHFEDMAQRMERKGCKVLPLDFDVGSRPLDRFIDLPPFDLPGDNVKSWSGDTMHIKLNIDGFPCTSFGMVVVKNA